MIRLLSIIFFIFSLTLQAQAHGDQKHDESKEEEKTVIDDDGFEIVSSAHSQATLGKINTNYLNTVKTIFSNKCLSCHGVNNSPPWYYHIPGPKQMMDYDMKEAKKHMDMSNDFPFGGHGSPIDDLNALSKTLKKGNMPPLKYLLLHWRSKLTKEEINVVNKWITNSKNILKGSK